MGNVTFQRRVLEKAPVWKVSSKTLSHVDLRLTGTIEDDGAGMIQADFANKKIGGGVLGWVSGGHYSRRSASSLDSLSFSFLSLFVSFFFLFPIGSGPGGDSVSDMPRAHCLTSFCGAIVLEGGGRDHWSRKVVDYNYISLFFKESILLAFLFFQIFFP